MSNTFDSKTLVALLGAAVLTACGGGGGGSPSPSSSAPAPAPVPSPAPAPAPTPAPSPPPAPGSTVPPQAATAVDLDDNHQVGTTHWVDGDTADGGQGGTTAGLNCNVNTDETYHVHSHLSIFLNGEALAVPGHIGIVKQSDGNDCFYSLHTHDSSGKLHVEAPAEGMFTLGQVFTIWGEPLSDTNVAGLTGMPVVVYVTDNGTVTQVDSDWDKIELKSHREITIQVGTPITEIPNFTWTAH